MKGAIATQISNWVAVLEHLVLGWTVLRGFLDLPLMSQQLALHELRLEERFSR
jgi:hypothetical protein